MRDAIENSLAAVVPAVTPTWTLSNHDVDREVTRYGGGEIGSGPGAGHDDGDLALPGTVFLYGGEELGLPNVDLPDEVLQDPVWERSGRTCAGATAAAYPSPGRVTAPPFGFSANPDTWLPMPVGLGRTHCRKQLRDAGLDAPAFYRSGAPPCAHQRPEFAGDQGGLASPPHPGVFSFRVRAAALTCFLNTGDTPGSDRPWGELLFSSATRPSAGTVAHRRTAGIAIEYG